MNKGEFVFVYGTLRRGMSAESRMLGATFVTNDEISGTMYDMGWYPGVVLPDSANFDETAPTVYGEIFQIDDYSLPPSLDAYEGYPSLYSRQIVVTKAGLFAWVYTINNPTSRLVSGGDWLAYLDEGEQV